jgi:hypothetical protein
MLAIVVYSVGEHESNDGSTTDTSSTAAAPSSPSPSSRTPLDGGAWERARVRADDPDKIKNAHDLAGSCVLNSATGAKICGTQAIDFCVSGPIGMQDACTVILADAFERKP